MSQVAASQSTGKDPRPVKYATKAGVFHGSYTETTKALRDFIDEIERGKIQRLHSLHVRGIPRLLPKETRNRPS